MFKTLDEFDQMAHAILVAVRDGGSFRDPLSQCDKEDFDDALEYCVSSGFIRGITVQRTASGRLVSNVTGSVRLTRDGLCFIEKRARD